MANTNKAGSNVAIDLAKVFKLNKAQKQKLEEEGVEGLFDYNKKLPKGAGFIARFSPVEPWKIGLQGFSIHGLERSLHVTRQADVILNRKQAVAMVKTLLKPGDVELEDVYFAHTDQFTEAVEEEEPANDKEPAKETE